MRTLLPFDDGEDDFDDTPPWSRSEAIVAIVNDTDLLRRHFERIEQTVVAAEPSPTYWPAVRGLLDFPGGPSHESAAAVPRFDAAAAKANVPKAREPKLTLTPGSGNSMLAELLKRRDAAVAALTKMAADAGLPPDAVAAAAGSLAGMGTRFRGRVNGFDRELSVRFIAASGNYAMFQDENDAPLRIWFKDFVAAVESGDLCEEDAAGDGSGGG